MSLINNFFFIGLPYLAIASFLVGAIYRYRMSGFKYSSLSAQFLEGTGPYLYVTLFHWGILGVFVGHLLTFLVPGITLAWYSNEGRMIFNEIIMLSFGLSALIGLIGLFLRRFTEPRIAVVTNWMDMVIEAVLILQFFLGLWTALGYRWGFYWFAADLSPYLWSIFTFNPQVEMVSALPGVIQTHIVGAFIIIALLPFTRLVHFLVAPLHYTWRSYQQVIWYWDRKAIRDPATVWTQTRPMNN